MPDSDEPPLEALSKIFSALGSPVRLRILSIVYETKRPLHIKAVAETLRMDYAAIYRHVDVLKKAKLVQIFEVGRSRVLSPLHADLVEQVFALVQRMEK